MSPFSKDETRYGSSSHPYPQAIFDDEFQQLKKITQELRKRNIYMKFKYIARLYQSGAIQQMVETLNKTHSKRKRSNEHLPDAKRKVEDASENDQSSDVRDNADTVDSNSDSSNSSDDEYEEDAEDSEQEEGTKDNDASNTVRVVTHTELYCCRQVPSQVDSLVYTSLIKIKKWY